MSIFVEISTCFHRIFFNLQKVVKVPVSHNIWILYQCKCATLTCKLWSASPGQGFPLWGTLPSSVKKKKPNPLTPRWVRWNEWVTTSAMWQQLNIFVIMCKYIIFVHAQSQQRKAEAKICLSLLQRCYADLKNIWRLTQDSVGEIRLIAWWSTPCYLAHLHDNGRTDQPI